MGKNRESQYFQKAWNVVAGPQPVESLVELPGFFIPPRSNQGTARAPTYSLLLMQRYEELWDYRRFRPVFRPLPFNRTMFTRGGGGESKQSCVIRNNPAFSWVVRVFGGLAAFLLNVGRFFIFICLVAHRKKATRWFRRRRSFFIYFFFLPRTRGKLNLQDFLCSRLVFPIISRILIADKSEIDCDIKWKNKKHKEKETLATPKGSRVFPLEFRECNARSPDNLHKI